MDTSTSNLCDDGMMDKEKGKKERSANIGISGRSAKLTISLLASSLLN
jgi:hypothetical protein